MSRLNTSANLIKENRFIGITIGKPQAIDIQQSDLQLIPQETEVTVIIGAMVCKGHYRYFVTAEYAGRKYAGWLDDNLVTRDLDDAS